MENRSGNRPVFNFDLLQKSFHKFLLFLSYDLCIFESPTGVMVHQPW